MEMYKVEFLFLGGPLHNKRVSISVKDIGCSPDYFEVQQEMLGHGFEVIRYVLRKLVSSTGFTRDIYVDGRLSEDKQNDLVYEWVQT
ncbi:hypothetical protein [Shewanella baltica]|nr:hypothetical protein [Gammaproteobacteria bacterium]MBU1477460.1 hypothetical protein [Gammaproteobacteria bacterium]MBU2002623.1 hypothetical protein [Gammaproteobacteria bacterium]MBU2131798.1 hypothetical protein [Gammaproteobacteria bacterium]MBU2186533.1 hypothetical protein [Gammaproteobacteria bacterium]